MAQFKDYEDEIKDFSLLVNNQFLLSMVMQEIPIISYKMEVYTEDILQKFNMAAFTEIHFLVANKDKYKLELRIVESDGSDFKFIAVLFYEAIIVPKGTISDDDLKEFMTDNAPGKILEYEASKVEYNTEEKVFYFKPTMSQGEAIVNELSIWLKEQIALKVSGLN